MTATKGITAGEFESMVRETFGVDLRVERLAPDDARVRLAFDERQLRPGGTIAGPVMFTLADTVLYALVLAVDRAARMAVTTDISIRFLRRPPPADLIAEGRLIKPRGRLMVGDVTIYSAAREHPVAHATGTYLVPGGAGAGGQ